jgi:hypothetical protein
MLRLASVALVWAVVSLLAPFDSSGAAGSTPDVGALVASAQAKFKAGEYAAALMDYESALAAGAPAPLQFMVGRCHQQLEHWEAARAAFESFLAAEGLTAEQRGRGEAELTAVTRRLAKATLLIQVAPFGAAVFVDGVAVGQAPLEPLDVAPGEHVVRAESAERDPVERRVTVGGGERASVVIELVARAPAAPEPLPALVVESGGTAPPGGSRLSPWTWVTLGSGLAVAAGGTVSYVLGEVDHQEVVDAQADGSMPRRRALDLESAGDTKKVVGYALWGVGGALVATSVVLFLLDGPAEPAGSVTVGAAPLAGGGGLVTIGGGF